MSSLLRNRFIEDLRIRHYAERTIEIYVYCVAKFAQFFGRSPEHLGEDEIREYQRYLVYEKKASWAFFNQTVCALRFFYTKTLGKAWLVRHIPFPRKERRLPEVLGIDEVSRLLDSVRALKQRTVLESMYATGMRLSETLRLETSDIDSERMVLRVRQGKGRKDRYVTMFRWKDYANNNQQRVMTLDAVQFLRRFLLHVLPNNFMRVRDYGFLANRHRQEKLSRMRHLLGQAEPAALQSELNDSIAVAALDAESDEQATTTDGFDLCPQCRNGRLRVIAPLQAKPVFFLNAGVSILHEHLRLGGSLHADSTAEPCQLDGLSRRPDALLRLCTTPSYDLPRRDIIPASNHISPTSIRPEQPHRRR